MCKCDVGNFVLAYRFVNGVRRKYLSSLGCMGKCLEHGG